MSAFRWVLIHVSMFASIALLNWGPTAAQAVAASPEHTRTFDFTYAAVISGLTPRQICHIWLPVPQDSASQKAELIRQDLPVPMHVQSDESGQNRIAYMQAPADADGKISISIVYRIARREVSEVPAVNPPSDDAKYLAANALIPIGGQPATLIQGLTLPGDQLKLGRVLYDLVDDRLEYRKDKPGWGRGDATWACQSGFGNCTDFHSLFISLARTEKLPSRFEIGFPLPAARGQGQISGYHCWAWFKPDGHGWVPVDISEANQNPSRRNYFFGHLDENRVAFSVGRDLNLTPRQVGPPINFLIYPYVEVNGQPLPTSQVHGEYAYRDIAPGQERGR